MQAMPRLLRFGISAGVLGLFLTALLVFALAASRIARVGAEIVAGRAAFEQELELIGTVDLLLLGIGILIIAAGIISLTMQKISLPGGLRFKDLHQLKSTFSSFLILIMAIVYLEAMAPLKQLEQGGDGRPETLFYGGLGFLAVTIALVIFQRSGDHQHLPGQDATD
jgi:uncharacterized membrane protein YqhA